MRIRNFRQADIPILIDLQQLAAATDGLAVEDMIDFAPWSTYPEMGEANTVFVITDDDETNEWGQAGTLEGVEGEIVGFTALSMRRDVYAYHFLCQGTVQDRKSTRLNSSHANISYAVFCLKKKKTNQPNMKT